MFLKELVEEIYTENPEVEALACGHNVGFTDQFTQVPPAITARIQDQIRSEFGAVVELYHGTERELPTDLDWRDNSSFTREFDVEFAGEDGYIIVAQVPVERIRFYLPGEDEFVIIAGRLDCEVFTVAEYFGL